MKKMDVYDKEGRTREEREDCIPHFEEKNKMKGAGTR